MKILALVVAAVALIFAFEGTTIRKDLVAERQTIDSDWQQVETSMARRAALVPELTRYIAAGAPRDAESVRSQAIPALNDACRALNAAQLPHEKMQANARLDQALGKLM